ncbi:MAG: LOW QUALITY PROTEIN: hypothetical protein KVP17_003558 [Porospora cf. gigantea B]|uniref:uncharacterized protein n=1 Tax=Porospora cf. gigantea B TaxID=2853592 RepID=UPI003571C6FD|nr:MAG: LOW QUALITY PROTEIN: hypothetical protein KVP17_003558 [Porospora cf. gigantea B]
MHLCGGIFGLTSVYEDPDTDVSLTDRPLEDYLEIMRRRNEISKRVLGHPVRIFSWLPVYHDMGLIGMTLAPLMGGCSLVQMSPAEFMRRPCSWLSRLSLYECVGTAAPNFALDLVVERVPTEVLLSLDFRYLSSILCGAEAVRPSTVAAFENKFKQCGLRQGTIIPAYGLAEHTLIVSGTRDLLQLSIDRVACERGLVRPLREGGIDLIGLGHPCPGVDVVIVDAATCREQDEDSTGEIWVKSRSVAKGYFGSDSPAFSGFCYRKHGERVGPWLRTGDTGFFYQHQLFVVGRIKDVMIIRGRNVFPADIEQCVEKSVEYVRKGRAVAFCTGELDPALCVAVEVKDAFFRSRLTQLLRGQKTANPIGSDEAFGLHIATQVRASVSRSTGLHCQDVFLFKPRTIPKTTSGKLRRGTLKEMIVSQADAPGLLFMSQGKTCCQYKTPQPPLDLESLPSDIQGLSFRVVDEVMSIMDDVLPFHDLCSQADGVVKRVQALIVDAGVDSPGLFYLMHAVRLRFQSADVAFPTEFFLNEPTFLDIIRLVTKAVAEAKKLKGEQHLQLTSDEQISTKDILEHIRCHCTEYRLHCSVDPIRDLSELLPLCEVQTMESRGRYGENLLLTGATGFLGHWVLAELLKRTNSRVHCFIRKSEADFLADLSAASWWSASFASRVRPIRADVALSKFGLSPQSFETLSLEIDSIYHFAADVGLMKAYASLRSTNVLGTLRLAMFASTGRLKRLHFASTLGVWPEYFQSVNGTVPTMQTDIKRRLLECQRPSVEDILQVFDPAQQGYAFSKWVAEQLLERFFQNGLPCAVYRLPIVAICLATKKLQTANVCVKLMASMLQSGTVCYSTRFLATSSVEAVARRVVAVGCNSVWTKLSHFPVMHVADIRCPTGQDISALMARVGLTLTPVDSPDCVLRALDTENLVSLGPLATSTRLRSLFFPNKAVAWSPNVSIDTTLFTTLYETSCGPLRQESVAEVLQTIFFAMLKSEVSSLSRCVRVSLPDDESVLKRSFTEGLALSMVSSMDNLLRSGRVLMSPKKTIMYCLWMKTARRLATSFPQLTETPLGHLLVVNCSDPAPAAMLQTALVRLGGGRFFSISLRDVLGSDALDVVKLFQGTGEIDDQVDPEILMDMPLGDSVLIDLLPDVNPSETMCARLHRPTEVTPCPNRLRLHRDMLHRHAPGKIIVVSSAFYMWHLDELRAVWERVDVVDVVAPVVGIGQCWMSRDDLRVDASTVSTNPYAVVRQVACSLGLVPAPPESDPTAVFVRTILQLGGGQHLPLRSRRLHNWVGYLIDTAPTLLLLWVMTVVLYLRAFLKRVRSFQALTSSSQQC